MRTNWLDNAIGFLNPQAGFRRARARVAMDVMLSYEGAKTGRLAGGWVTSGTSANAEIGVDLPTLRNRSHDLVRNNPYAARMQSEIVQNSIGTGIRAQARNKAKRVNEKIDTAWKIWTEQCDADGQHDFFGLQELAAKAIVESGEVLIRHRSRRPDDGLAIPYQVQLLESDFLDMSKTGPTPTGYIIQGIEFDLIGRRIAYWLFPSHPGDSILTTSKSGYSSVRIPASEIAHVYQKTRPGQVHGVPWLTPVMMKLRDLDDFQLAAITKAKLEACGVAAITQEEGEDGQSLGPEGTDTETGEPTTTFRPGGVWKLKPGQDVKFNTPSGSGGYNDFVLDHQGTAAAALGMNRWQMNGSLAEINYSSFKAGHISFRNGIESFRWNCFIPMFCKPVRNRFVDTAFLAGLIPEPDYSTEWTPPAFASADPLKDSMASKMDVRTGRKTWEQSVSEMGYDPMEQLDAIERIFDEFDKRKIVLDSDPRKVAQTGVAQQTIPGGIDGQVQAD